MITDEKRNDLLLELVQGLMQLEDLFSYDDETMPESVKLESIKLARGQIKELLTPEVMKVFYDDVRKDYLDFCRQQQQLELFDINYKKIN
jgi:hypothetical protein